MDQQQHQSLFSLFHQGNKTTFHENTMELHFHQKFDRSYVRHLANDLRQDCPKQKKFHVMYF